MRLHLRVEREGSGVLFRDVTEVVHLNATATDLSLIHISEPTRPY